MNPIGRCNAAYADFDLREDFEALTNRIRDRQDHRAREREALEAARVTLEAFENGDDPGEQALVEARVVQWTLEDLLGRSDGYS